MADEPLTMDRYLSMDHALVTTADHGPGLADVAVPDELALRRIVLRLPFFSALPDAIVGSGLAATLPVQLARKLFRNHAVALRPLPIAIARLSYTLLWHPRSHRNPVNQWARNRIVEACRNVTIARHPSEK